jgi:hypothetical protein
VASRMPELYQLQHDYGKNSIDASGLLPVHVSQLWEHLHSRLCYYVLATPTSALGGNGAADEWPADGPGCLVTDEHNNALKLQATALHNPFDHTQL